MNDINFYLSKIAPEHAGKPKFAATVAMTVQPLVDAQALAQSLPAYFDLDNAIGDQLDIDGEWIGRSRDIPLPSPDLWFSFDDDVRGFDKGIIWNAQVNPGSTLSVLDDTTYRRLLKSVAIANEWDGTASGGQPVLDQFFPSGQGTFAFVSDEGWGVESAVDVSMQMSICISGVIPPTLDLEIMSQGLLGLKPASVQVNYIVTSVDGLPIFGFDSDNQFIGGFDDAAIGVDSQFVIDNAIEQATP